MLIVQTPFANVLDRLNLTETQINRIERTIQYGIYNAYLDREHSEEDFDVTAVTNDIFVQYSGNELIAAAYLLGQYERDAEEGVIDNVIQHLMLAAEAMFGTVKVNIDQFNAACEIVDRYIIETTTGV